MSNSIKSVMAIGLAAFVSACTAPREEVVFVEPDAVVAEPVFTGKFR
ncbi:hypothetical protein [Brevirhabdus sp.]